MPAPEPRLPAATRPRAADEFPAGAAGWPADLDRRDFLKMLGGSLALAGLAGCGARPAERILPYVAAPEYLVPGRPEAYATAFAFDGFARGVLVTSQDGRPVKIEGNPDHPESLGATDAITQASVLSLYDPDRSQSPSRDGVPAAWLAFEAAWRERHAALARNGGAGLALLTEPTTSPSEQRELRRLLALLPRARWFQHTPLARPDLDGAQADHALAGADVIFAIGSDFLHHDPAALRHARAFAARRRVEGGRVNLNRLYVAEPAPTVTGALGDVRLPASPARIRRVLDAIARRHAGGIAGDGLAETERAFVDRLVEDFRAHPGRAVCLAGPQFGDDVRRWARAMNARLGAAGRLERLLPPVRSDGDARSAGGLAELAAAIDDGGVDTLFILGANPVYTAPGDLDIAPRLRRVGFTVHHGEHADETAAACGWHLPASHYLESWSDLRAAGGEATIVQPLIRPLYATRSRLEMLRLLADPAGGDGYDLVRATWREARPGDDFEAAWAGWLRRGVIDAPPPRPLAAPAPDLPVLAADESAGGTALTLVLQPDPKVLDGRHANNPWLQELPHPLTTLTWDNALTLSPALADRLGLADGDVVELNAGGRTLAVPVLALPGQAADCVALALGYGRVRAGQVGNGRGADAYRLRRRAAPWIIPGAELRPLGRRQLLARTQGHFRMEGRDLVRRVTPADLAVEPEETPSLYDAWPDDDYAWGMSIDLGTCIGCNACIVACQAENNIPCVGPEQVARGREMHWLRVDRYFSGDAANPQMLVQPVPCMHCEHAPCEVVCPVHATVHSSEGLNDMIYNRCVGTRYCSNNCPYKVRRFNFLDFRPPADSPVVLQQNPRVTVRERGVMEKCTYCVQRINAARITAERAGRRIRDGEAVTACQQACPAGAIVFGDLRDRDSLVSRRKREPHDYGLLAELNTRPRTTYLARVLPRADAPQPGRAGTA